MGNFISCSSRCGIYFQLVGQVPFAPDTVKDCVRSLLFIKTKNPSPYSSPHWGEDIKLSLSPWGEGYRSKIPP